MKHFLDTTVAQVIKDEIVIMMDRESSGASQKSESLVDTTIHMNTAPQPPKSQHTTGLWNNRKLVTAALDKIADENPNKNPPGCNDNGSTPDFLQLAAPGGPWTRGLNGEDIVVGVIDDGIWPEHPSFADDGSYSVLPGFSDIPCVFGNTTHNSKDLGSRYILDTHNKIKGVAADEFYSSRDHDGHGTHTASTAAGNSDVEAIINGETCGRISGVAHRSRVISYKALSNRGGYMSDLVKAIDLACQDGVDVINISIGTRKEDFPYLDGFLATLDSIAFLNVANSGVLVSAGAGNSGPASSTTDKSAPWYTSVAASTGPDRSQDPASFTPQMAKFSSKGPNLDSCGGTQTQFNSKCRRLDIIKPDITAPGVGVLAGLNLTGKGPLQGCLLFSVEHRWLLPILLVSMLS